MTINGQLCTDIQQRRGLTRASADGPLLGWDGRFERTPQKHAQLTAVPHLRLTFSLESPTSVSLQLTDSPIRTYLGSYLGSAEHRIDQVRNHVTLLLRLYFITAFQRARRQRGGGITSFGRLFGRRTFFSFCTLSITVLLIRFVYYPYRQPNQTKFDQSDLLFLLPYCSIV